MLRSGHGRPILTLCTLVTLALGGPSVAQAAPRSARDTATISVRGKGASSSGRLTFRLQRIAGRDVVAASVHRGSRRQAVRVGAVRRALSGSRVLSVVVGRRSRLKRTRGAYRLRLNTRRRKAAKRPKGTAGDAPSAPASPPVGSAPPVGSTPAAPSSTPATPSSTPAATVPAPPPTNPPTAAPGSVLLRDGFDGPDGLITNHYAMWAGDPKAAFDPTWEVESGSVFRRAGAAWSGVPTDNLPNITGSNGSGSQIFRMWTRRSDFRAVQVDFDLRNEGFAAGSAMYPAVSWDGVKIWLRRQGGSGSVALYTAEVNRRQGNVMIQKKCAGSSDYSILGQTRSNSRPASVGSWERVGGRVTTNADGSVSLAVLRHGEVVLTATDDGVGCAPITGSGKIGIRADNTQFSVDDLVVSALDG